MADLLQRPLPQQTASPLSANARLSPDLTLLNQTVLRWQTAIFAPSYNAQPWSVDRLAILHRFVKRIAQVRVMAHAETNADPSVLSSASPTLLKQVLPEAQAVLHVVSAIEPAAAPHLVTSTQPQYAAQSLKTLIPWLLWNFAQTTHEAVQLIEGWDGQVKQGDSWQAGTLRLVVGLKLTHSSAIYAFDLVTQQALPKLLPLKAELRVIEGMPESVLLQASSTVEAVLQRLTTQFKSHPVLNQYWKGFAADWLIPYHNWQAGTAALHLGFEFISTASATPADRNQSHDAALHPSIKLTQSAWIEQHISIAVEHQLNQVLNSITPALEHLPEESDRALLQIVEQGCAAMDELQGSLALASRTFAQQPLSLDTLGLRLLWGINRTAYEVMQLTSGLAVNLFLPQANWQNGILRFVVQLVVKTADQVWQWDLVQRTNTSALITPPMNALVQSSHAWCTEPTLLGDLETQVWRSIEQAAPELALLRTATEAIVTIDSTGHLGTVHLIAGFEFTAV